MKRVAVEAIRGDVGGFAGQACRRIINFWRTRATELPQPASVLELGDVQIMEAYQGEPVWGVKVPPIDTALRCRCSNWLAGNTFLMILTALSTMLLVWQKSTRAAGLWLAAILLYFSVVTGLIEIPAYRYRMVVEPLVLLVIVCALVRFLPVSASRSPETA